MRKTIRWFIAAAVFLAVFFILFCSANEILRRKTGVELDMVHTFYDVEEQTLDVVCVGSSHLFFSVLPNVLWEEQGITSYVMGSPQQSVPSSYFLLKEALNYQKPKVVLLESYFFFLDRLYNGDARLRQAFDGMKNGPVKEEMLKTFLPELTWKEKLSYYLPFLKYHSRWQELEPYDFVQKPYLKGGYPKYKTEKIKEPSLDVPVQEIPSVSLEYLDRIYELCRENDIQLVVFAAPFGQKTKSSYAVGQGINLALEEHLAELGIPFLFYQKSGDVAFDYASDFQDVTHLNAQGAEKLTSSLGRYLTETCGLTGHKGDPAYASWDEDYQLYLQDKALQTAE